MVEQWRKGIEAFVQQNEAAITCLLIAVAAILLLIAIFGSYKHKAWAMLYIVL